MSHRKTIGVAVGQGKQQKKKREINIPSVVKGKEVSTKKAVEAFFGKDDEGMINKALGRKKSPNRKQVTKSFKNPEEATKASKKLSRSFDRKHR